jgi:hypothetical protein
LIVQDADLEYDPGSSVTVALADKADVVYSSRSSAVDPTASASGTRSATGCSTASNMVTNLTLTDGDVYKAFRHRVLDGFTLEDPSA